MKFTFYNKDKAPRIFFPENHNWKRTFYIDYDNSLRACRLKRIELFCERFIYTNYYFEVAGIGEKAVNFCGYYDTTRLYDSVENFKAKKPIKVYTYFNPTYFAQYMGVYGTACTENDKYGLYRYYWDGTKSVPFLVDLPEKIVFDENGIVNGPALSSLSGYRTQEECEMYNSVHVTEFEPQTAENKPKHEVKVSVDGTELNVSVEVVNIILSCL